MRKLVLTLVYASVCISCFARNQDLDHLETEIEAADQVWKNGHPGQAVPLYLKVFGTLENTRIVGEKDVYRSFLIMRTAKAQLAAGDKQGCLQTISLLGKLRYVPEHHALVAEEMRTAIAGGPNPGLQRTPIPETGKPHFSFFVSPVAGLGGDGSKRKPFSSIRDAVNRTRTLRKNGGSGAIEILLAPGSHTVTQTLELTAEDSGTEKSPLVIRSMDPRHPAWLTGGTVLKKWKTVSDNDILERLPESSRGRVLVCDLNANGVQDLGVLMFGGFQSERAFGWQEMQQTFPVPELFYKGKRQIMARWPNEGLTRMAIGNFPNDVEVSPHARNWPEETDFWLYGYLKNEWADSYEKIGNIGPNGRLCLVIPMSIHGHGRKMGYVLNALCEIDRPGEWMLDNHSRKIYYLPPAGFDPDEAVLSTCETVIDAKNCDFLQVRDIDVRFVRGDAMVFQDCSDLLVANVNIENTSGTAMKIFRGQRQMVHSCSISKMGRSGIEMCVGDWKALIPANSLIENCRISDISRIDHTYTPAVRMGGMGVTVRYCSFLNIPSSAIRMDGCDSLIELNYFRRCVWESGDQGAIDAYDNPLLRGNVIRWNDFDRIINNKSHFGAAAIRLDNIISGTMVYENIWRKGSDHGFGGSKTNGGTDTVWEGNVSIDWMRGITGGVQKGERWTKSISSRRGHKSEYMLRTTPWQSAAWRNKYPMVADLLNGDDNSNYTFDNVRFGYGEMGGFLTIQGDRDFHGETFEAIGRRLPPWNTLVKIKRIGIYSAEDTNN